MMLPTKAQPVHVLAVDDSASNLFILEEYFNKSHFVFHKASTAKECFKVLEHEPIHVVLLDVRLPDMMGYDVCQKIKDDERYHFVKVMMVTGLTQLEDKVKGYESGVDDYLCKPFDREELLARVKVLTRYVYVEEAYQRANAELEDMVEIRSEQLLKSCKLATLGQISSEIAHDIRNPLTAITGFVELLDELIQNNVDDEVAAKEKMQKFTNTIRSSGRMIEDILNSLKTYSRDGSDDPFKDVSVKSIVRNAVDLCHFNLTHKSIDVQVADVSDTLSVQCRGTQICQVLVNLINNSIDAVTSLDEKWIRLDMIDMGEDVKIMVTDSGNGIDEDIREQILTPFFSTKDPSQGTGLGLSISQAILSEHLGAFYIDTDCSNTRFVLEVPKLRNENSHILSSY